MSEIGIIKPLRQRIADLEEINKEHQKINGELQKVIQQKDKEIKKLKDQTVQLGFDKIELLKNGGQL